jgi:hypothetical protein
MRLYWLTFVLLSLSLRTAAQNISYLQALATGDFVSIYYTLDDSLPGQVYEVTLYSSHDRYEQPLQIVRGDVGADITGGSLKKIEWGATQELKRHRDSLTFEVRAKLTFSPITLLFPYSGAGLQRGDTYSVSWQGELAGDSLELMLLAQGQNPIPIAVVPNTGHYEWTLPARLAEGNRYRLQLSWWNGGRNYQTRSGAFSIRRKVPKNQR